MIKNLIIIFNVIWICTSLLATSTIPNIQSLADDYEKHESGKFNTNSESFNKNYINVAHHQAAFNAEIINQLSESIIKWFPDTDKEPLRILDLCCGHGKPTYDLLCKLRSKDINISKITGYDISQELILQAQSKYQQEKKLEFKVQNAETLTEENNFDIIISLFGLHWMENIEKTAFVIARALKSGGKVMFFVPLEKMDLYKYRKNFLENSSWKNYCENYILHPFIDDSSIYINAFDKYFTHETSNTKKGEKSILYTTKEFNDFLSSWFQELRYLRGKVECSKYVEEFINSIPIIPEGNVIKQDNNVLFTEHFFSYQGSLHKLN